MKTDSKGARMDKKLWSDLFRAGVVRVEKQLSKCDYKDMGMPKITNLLRRCPSYPSLLEELKKLPEKENGK